jgi:hypothetical protein
VRIYGPDGTFIGDVTGNRIEEVRGLVKAPSKD